MKTIFSTMALAMFISLLSINEAISQTVDFVVDNQTSTCDVDVKARAFVDPDLCTGTMCSSAWTTVLAGNNTPTIPPCGGGTLIWEGVRIRENGSNTPLAQLSNCAGVYTQTFTCNGQTRTATLSGTTVTIQ